MMITYNKENCFNPEEMHLAEVFIGLNSLSCVFLGFFIVLFFGEWWDFT